MSNEGLRYFYNTMHFPPNSWRVFYDFVPSSNNIPSLSGANSTYSGIPSLPTTGTFSGQSVKISNEESLNAPNWAMMCVFGKNPNSYGTLFSNYHGEQIKSGFTVGVTSNNRLYLETSNQVSPLFYESSVDLATKNAVFVNKIFNRLELSYFDFNSKQITTDSFPIEPNSFLTSDNWYVGDAVSPPSYFSGQPFRGQIEKFLYFTGTIFPPQRNSLFSGLTLLRAPEYVRDLLQESSAYSYLNLTGQFSNVTFDIINQAIYLIQTGYLFDKTGLLTGLVTGNVNLGFGSITGYISGIITQPSGYTITNTGFVSGFSGYAEIGHGVRAFSSNIPSGTSSYFISFPDYFVSDPVIFTELQNQTTFTNREISEISSSGFYVSFLPPISSTGYVLNTTAAPEQVSEDFKFFKVSIPTDTENFYINYPFDPILNPKIFSQLESSESPIPSYGISQVSNTGFNVNFSGRVESLDAALHVCATNLNVESGFRASFTPLASGTNSQFISYAPAFAETPIVFGQITNASGESLVPYKISGVSPTGFFALFSGTLVSNNYIFNSLAWSGIQTGVRYVTDTQSQQVYIGQVTDEAENVYNMSGFQNVTVSNQFDTSLYKAVYSTGITGDTHTEYVYIDSGIHIDVGYQLALGTGELAYYVHEIDYQNNGDNLITANHTLYYSGLSVQPDPFTVLKNSYQIFGYRLESFTYDTGYIFGFGMDGVRYLYDLDDEGINELYIFETGNNKTNLNLRGVFDRSSQEFFVRSPYSNSSVNIYLNGVGQYGGGFKVINYAPYTLQLDADYTMSGNYPFMDRFAEETDELLYDAISSNRKYKYVPSGYRLDSGTGFLDNFEVSQYGLYLNGVKLLSGLDYTTSGDTVRIIDTGINDVSGRMFILPLDKDNKTRYTGDFEYLETPAFAKNTSMLWLNGIRQDLGIQYIETSKVSLLTGSKTHISGYPLIFNSTSLFWQ